MVRDVFRLAKENAPAIIFIDEVDAIATSRFDAQVRAYSGDDDGARGMTVGGVGCSCVPCMHANGCCYMASVERGMRAAQSQSQSQDL